MLNAFRIFLVAFANAVLSLRYKVTVTGLESVRGLRKAIILPNHPGYIDPPLVLKTLFPVLRPRPMLLASIFHNPLLFWLPKVLDAVEIPDLEQASTEARQQTHATIQSVIDGLKSGSNHILWPSGRVYHTVGKESLGAARSVSEILQADPDAQIILVRTRGVWGSSFSFARTGKRPNLPLALIKGMGILAANLLLLTPRRPVHIDVELLDRAKLPGLSRDQVNPFLDAWYNAPGEEAPSYTPYHFAFGPRTFDFPKLDATADLDLSRIKPATRTAIANMVAEKLKRDPSSTESEPATKLEALGLDSLDRMDLSLEVERRFGFSAPEVPATIGALWALAEGMIKGTELPPPPPAWFRTASETSRLGILAPTMARAFVDRCLLSGDAAAAADDMSGVVTYRRLLVGATLLSRRFAAYPAPNIGILLPASVAADSVFFALHLAGKLPVILNFTTGPANLAHAAKVMGLTHIITSRRFVDRTGIQVEGAQYVYLEDLRTTISKPEALATLLRTRLTPGYFRHHLPAQQPNEPAVVLFTSGSEKAPKAVPLTHANIFSNITAALTDFHITGAESFIGFLPPFHSFGVTVTMVLPIVAGARVVHHPDPTDAATIARKLAAYQVTLVCATPTFISYILDRVRPGDLKSLRLMVAGAEKCPDHIFEKGARLAPNATVIEGYGITECSPIVAVNPENAPRRGSIGKPLSNLHVRIVDIDTHQHPLPVGQTGMLLVHGPSIFPGYIGEGATSPFVELDGLTWYLTGDLARLDADGYLWFEGRLKRFLKAGGEMISLPAIEAPFAEAYPPTDNGPQVAVEGIETPDGRHIVLFTTTPVTLREANQRLVNHGLRGIMRLDEVRSIDKIPTLGTGKTDYKPLKAQLTAQWGG